MFDFIGHLIDGACAVYTIVTMVAISANAFQGGVDPFELIGMLWRGEVKKK